MSVSINQIENLNAEKDSNQMILVIFDLRSGGFYEA